MKFAEEILQPTDNTKQIEKLGGEVITIRGIPGTCDRKDCMKLWLDPNMQSYIIITREDIVDAKKVSEDSEYILVTVGADSKLELVNQKILEARFIEDLNARPNSNALLLDGNECELEHSRCVHHTVRPFLEDASHAAAQGDTYREAKALQRAYVAMRKCDADRESCNSNTFSLDDRLLAKMRYYSDRSDPFTFGWRT